MRPHRSLVLVSARNSCDLCQGAGVVLMQQVGRVWCPHCNAARAFDVDEARPVPILPAPARSDIPRGAA